jgi:hypothetical protein
MFNLPCATRRAGVYELPMRGKELFFFWDSPYAKFFEMQRCNLPNRN